jgi:prepilin-type N-terminal cleavage/methylation domain-containing protein
MHFRKFKKAFTIVELLIALAITAMLLAAVAVAFNASVINYQENEKMYQTMNNARQAMLRMTAQLRTADVNSVSTTSTECNLTTVGGQYLTYEFRDESYSDPACRNKLYLIENGNDYVLCDNVTAMSFTQKVDGSRVESVQISLTVSIGNTSQTISSAAAIRKNLE